MLPGEAKLYAEMVIQSQHAPKDEGGVPEDPDGEFVYTSGDKPRADGPRIINVGVPGPGFKVSLWRRAWRDKILPAVVNFAPDLILISAGFDAHRKDEINFQFVGVREHDFAWLTDQIVQVCPISTALCILLRAASVMPLAVWLLTFPFALPTQWWGLFGFCKHPATGMNRLKSCVRVLIGTNFCGSL